MSGSLSHSPIDILRQLLIDLSLGVTGTTSAWSVFTGSKPDSPDSCIVLLETSPEILGELQTSGETIENHGIQLLVRSMSRSTAFTKANTIAQTLETTGPNTVVTVSSTSYNVHDVSRSSGPFHVGKETPESKRELFSYNVLMSVRQIP